MVGTAQSDYKALSLVSTSSHSKIWIQQDSTEVGIANQLVELGVPKEDIVLGFDPPKMLHYTDFAVG